MAIEDLIISLAIGAFAGWLAGRVMKTGAYGPVGDLILGIIGAVGAGWQLPQFGILIGGELIGTLINAFVGVCIALLIFRPLIKRA